MEDGRLDTKNVATKTDVSNMDIYMDIHTMPLKRKSSLLYAKIILKSFPEIDVYSAISARNGCFPYASMSTRYLAGDTGIKAFCKTIAHKFFSDYFLKKEQKAYTNYENVCKKYNSLTTEKISTLSFQFSNMQHIKYRADYLELIEVPFEFMTIPIGRNYDHALKARYGDYMTIIKGNSEHGGVILDPEISYTNRLSEF